MRNTTTEPKRPTHNIWRVTGEKDNARWTKVGAAWPNGDGNGFNLVFDAVPVTGRTVLRKITDRTAAQNGGQQ